jgi:thiol-disulfide isomerase/thioredoxin
MKNRHLVFTTIIAFCTWIILFSQDKIQKPDTLNLLISSAKKNNKKLFLVFGWEGCGWCRRLDKYHNDPKVKNILNRYFMISYIDIYKSANGQDLYKRYGKGGTPSWTVFDSQGKIMVDSDLGKGNIGYPATDDEINSYILAIKKAVPNLKRSDCDLLIEKLKEYRTKKE